jgi:redox-sensitive bicupin YhaK (pirin superfamily)
MYGAVLERGDSIDHRIPPGRHAWVQCVTGEIAVNDLTLRAGDGVAVSDEAALTLRGANGGASELLLFDLA